MPSLSLAAPLRLPAPRAPRAQRSGRAVRVCANFKARWSLDVKFGSKLDAVALLQEWVRDVGSQAGLTPDNTQLHSGSIGAPESTLELEVSFDSLADLEAFWAAIPPAQHKAWGQRMQQYIVHGSPQWHVYRTLPAFPEGGAAGAAGTAGMAGSAAARAVGGAARTPAAAAAPSSSSSSSSGSLVMPSEEELGKYAADAAVALPSTAQQTASGLSVVSGEEEAQVVLDWKGEPMKIKPGDKLPFKFL
ncbi:hypothetical protein ABPG75_009017 [Micractinium tetrahymenae]